MTKVHVAGAIALVSMAFMSIFILIVGIVAYQRKRSMVRNDLPSLPQRATKTEWSLTLQVSLVVSIVMCIYFAVCIGLFFITSNGKIISCTGGLIGCGVLFLIFAWRCAQAISMRCSHRALRWCCAADKRAFPHVIFMAICGIAAGLIVAGYFN